MYEELTEQQLLVENMVADSIEQQREFMEMQSMYMDNMLEA